MGQLQAEVTLFHEAGRCDEAHAAGDEDGLGVAVAKWLELAEPTGEDRSDAVEGQLGVNAEDSFGLACGEMLFRIQAQAALELRDGVGGHGESDGEGVATEAGEEICTAFDGIEKLEAVDGAAGAVGHAFFHADDDGGLGGALDDARGEDADDAAMPAFAIDDEKAVCGQVGFGCEAYFDRAEGGGFGVAAFAVEAFELGGELGGAVRSRGW